MTTEERAAYAARVGCSVPHLVNNIFRRAGHLKMPRQEFLIRLVKASDGKIRLEEAIDYFLVQPVLKMAAELESSPHQAKAGEVGLEMKRFDTPNQAAVLRRVVGRDCEQMQVGGGV